MFQDKVLDAKVDVIVKLETKVAVLRADLARKTKTYNERMTRTNPRKGAKQSIEQQRAAAKRNMNAVAAKLRAQEALLRAAIEDKERYEDSFNSQTEEQKAKVLQEQERHAELLKQKETERERKRMNAAIAETSTRIMVENVKGADNPPSFIAAAKVLKDQIKDVFGDEELTPVQRSRKLGRVLAQNVYNNYGKLAAAGSSLYGVYSFLTSAEFAAVLQYVKRKLNRTASPDSINSTNSTVSPVSTNSTNSTDVFVESLAQNLSTFAPDVLPVEVINKLVSVPTPLSPINTGAKIGAVIYGRSQNAKYTIPSEPGKSNVNFMSSTFSNVRPAELPRLKDREFIY